jgi:hypothetical protein
MSRVRISSPAPKRVCIFGDVGNNTAHVAQSVERFLGKEEVHRFDSGRGLQHKEIKTKGRINWGIETVIIKPGGFTNGEGKI